MRPLASAAPVPVAAAPVPAAAPQAAAPRPDAGFSIVLAVTTILLLLVLGLALVTLVAEDSELSLNHVESNRAFYVAHAGIEYAAQKLAADWSWRGLALPGKAVGAGAFWIAPPDTLDEKGGALPEGHRRIVATGIVGRAKRVIEAQVAPGTISSVAGGGSRRGRDGDGSPAVSARLENPVGVAAAVNGDLYIADAGDHSIRRVEFPTGTITTVAGTGVPGSRGDGGLAIEARLNGPEDVFVAPNGDLYIADTRNHAVRKVTAATGVISTVAGNRSPGAEGDGGPAVEARLSSPRAVAASEIGDLYIADTGNNKVRRVSAATGNIGTVAGTGAPGYSGDGARATAARLRAPEGVALGPNGDLYVADTGNHAVRRVALATGIMTGVAGTGAPGYSGDGAPATSALLESPVAIDFGPSGDLYVADTANHRIRRVRLSSGAISTIAGGVENGDLGDGGASTRARLDGPRGIAVSPDGRYYIGGGSSGRVRRVTGILSVVGWLEPPV